MTVFQYDYRYSDAKVIHVTITAENEQQAQSMFIDYLNRVGQWRWSSYVLDLEKPSLVSSYCNLLMV